MRFTLYLILFIFFSTSLCAQNFYVLGVNGDVFVGNKKLKKRSKVNIDDSLIFSNRDDQVNLISPQGHYNIRATQAVSSTNNELILELRNEILGVVSIAETAESIVTYMNIDSGLLYNTLIGPYTSLQNDAENSFFVQYTFMDSVYVKPLPTKDGRVVIDATSFPTTADTLQSYSVLSSSIVGETADTVLHFNVTQPTWLSEDKMVENLKILLENNVIRASYHLFEDAKEDFSKRGYLIPDEILRNIISEKIQWYDYNKSRRAFHTMITPSYFSLNDYQFSETEGKFYLVHMLGDTMFKRPVAMENGYCVIEEKSFDLEGISKEKMLGSSAMHALVYMDNDVVELSEAKPIHYFKPKHFVEARQLKKDVKYIRKKGKMDDSNSILVVMSDLLDAQYGEDSYLKETLLYLLED